MAKCEDEDEYIESKAASHKLLRNEDDEARRVVATTILANGELLSRLLSTGRSSNTYNSNLISCCGYS